jgi:hypothetical protein
MSRSNSDTSGQYISHNDITAARFEEASTWTTLVFFYCTNTNSQHAAIISKWNGGSGGASQFAVRLDQGAAPQDLEILFNNAIAFTTAASIQQDTWYLLGVTNDAGATNNIACYVFEMDGNILINGTTGTHNTDNGLTAPIRSHTVFHNGSAVGHFPGRVAHFSYFNTELSVGEMRQYLCNPASLVALHGSSGCEFYWPMGYSTEPDWSGNDRGPTVNGALSIASDPPISPMFAQSAGWQGNFTAAAGGSSIPVFMRSYRQRRV